MLGKLFNWIRRPLIDSQGTAQEAYQRSHNYTLSSVNGNGGHGVRSTVNAINPATIAVGPTLKRNDPAATGNNSYGIHLEPLYREIEFRRGGTTGQI